MKISIARWMATALVAMCGLCHAQSSGPLAKRMDVAPVIDGELTEWATFPQIAMKQPDVPDLKVTRASMGWSDEALHVAFRVVDSAVVNSNGFARLMDGDSIELRLVPDAGRKTFLRLVVAPSSAEGKPACSLTRRTVGTKATETLLATTGAPTLDGFQWALAREEKAWTVEATIPYSLLGGKPELGAAIPFVAVVWDRDRSDVDEWTIGSGWHTRCESSSQKAAVETWPVITLADATVKEVAQIQNDVSIMRLPALFSDHAVLQQGAPLPVWGWAAPGEVITVTIAGQTKTATAGTNSTWRVTLDPLKPGGPLTMTVSGKNTLTVRDLLVGEVWLCSGQSNMEFPVNRSLNFPQEQAKADFPQIRTFRVKRAISREPKTSCAGQWVVCASNTVGSFSATAYFFGRDLHQKLGVPVGLINASWGGTPAESWVSEEAMEAMPQGSVFTDPWKAKTALPWDKAAAMAVYEKQIAAWNIEAEWAKKKGRPEPWRPKPPVDPRLSAHHPANLYNGMIAPLIPYALQGAIWYQGESNARDDSAHLYGTILETLIQDWRTRWQSEFPFAWVQLPNYKASAYNWPLIRESMLQTLRVPKTGMAITIDVGQRDDIHPKNKQDVGHRLALWALSSVYGQKVESASGPLPAGHTINGAEVVCAFTHADGGLIAKDGPELKGFVIAGEDQKWFPASARIVGSNVVVSSPEVKAPVAVRYAWATDPDCNLYNGAGLPASPFRTDTFEIPVATPQK